jgi:two-component system chemotaxis response regulator CheB
LNELSSSKIKVLIVDDSAVVRQFVKEIIELDRQMEVVAVASDATTALKRIQKCRPDVITLDVEMPGSDGLTFLQDIMKTDPIPVVMLSSHTDKNAETTLKALELGAVDFITKPKVKIVDGIEALKDEIISKVKTAAAAKVKKKSVSPSHLEVTKAYHVDEVIKKQVVLKAGKTDTIIAIGASTGGTVAISDLLETLPADSPGIVIVQHMPEHFTKAYADRVNNIIPMRMKEAADGDRVKRGLVLLAPGGKHMLLERDAKGYFVRIKIGPPVNRHIPSVDVLFRSVAHVAGSNAVGVILTGMGADGARGMREMRDAGSFNIAQSEKSCVVFGMPKVAIEMGGIDKTVSIEQMASIILSHDVARKSA